jgi:hypothetical protein
VLVTVVETAAFIAQARTRMTEDERLAAIDMIACDPERGVLLRGGGGIRKMRFAVSGRGKSGGVRIVYYFGGTHMPVFLLAVFAKKERDDLSDAERSALAGFAKELARSYGVNR